MSYLPVGLKYTYEWANTLWNLRKMAASIFYVCKELGYSVEPCLVKSFSLKQDIEVECE